MSTTAWLIIGVVVVLFLAWCWALPHMVQDDPFEAALNESRQDLNRPDLTEWDRDWPYDWEGRGDFR